METARWRLPCSHGSRRTRVTFCKSVIASSPQSALRGRRQFRCQSGRRRESSMGNLYAIRSGARHDLQRADVRRSASRLSRRRRNRCHMEVRLPAATGDGRIHRAAGGSPMEGILAVGIFGMQSLNSRFHFLHCPDFLNRALPDICLTAEQTSESGAAKS